MSTEQVDKIVKVIRELGITVGISIGVLSIVLAIVGGCGK